MLGQDVVRAARFTNHEVVALARDALDVTDERAVRRAMEREQRYLDAIAGRALSQPEPPS